jgi:glycine cleavage system pyridoxal-binding protein P
MVSSILRGTFRKSVQRRDRFIRRRAPTSSNWTAAAVMASASAMTADKLLEKGTCQMTGIHRRQSHRRWAAAGGS